MGDVVRIQPPRTVAHIIADILLDEARLSKIRQKVWDGRELSMADDLAWGVLEQRIDANKVEAKTMIGAVTGVDWAEIEAALA